MFNLLNLFSSGESIFASGASLVNTYAQLRANGEKRSQALYEQQYYRRQLEEEKRFNQAEIFERTAEYGAISSYRVDMLRQEQMHDRQQLGYNILQSGIGITPTDSAGLLLRYTAHMDEMKARSVEAELFHGRPRSGFNPAMARLKLEAHSKHIKDIKSASPWQDGATVLREFLIWAPLVGLVPPTPRLRWTGSS